MGMEINVRLGTIIVMSINFIVMLAVLIRLLYRPIQGILEQRRQKIITELNNAKQAQEDAERLRHQAQIVLEEAHVEAYETVEKAKNEAERLREELITEARNEVDHLRQRVQAEIARSKQIARDQLRDEAVNLALQAVTKILGSHMSPELNEELIKGVLKDLEKEAQ